MQNPNNWSNEVRAAFISLVQAVFPVLNLTGIVNLTSDQISVVMLLVNQTVTFVFLLFSRRLVPVEVTTTTTEREIDPPGG